MKPVSLDQSLHDALANIPELGMSGFAVREGLTGAGVTILKGRIYFGSWRVTAGTLVWVYANVGAPNHFVQSIDEAVRHTMLLILQSLQTTHMLRTVRAAS